MGTRPLSSHVSAWSVRLSFRAGPDGRARKTMVTEEIDRMPYAARPLLSACLNAAFGSATETPCFQPEAAGQAWVEHMPGVDADGFPRPARAKGHNS